MEKYGGKVMDLTQEDLLKKLHYDPNTGVFTWRIKVSSQKLAGSVAGTNKDGYTAIGVNRKIYQAHRLAWLYAHGKWPDKHIDHINGERNDNKISNLREYDDLQNSRNRGKQWNNTSGYKGVAWHKRDNKWHAQCMINRIQHYVGSFNTAEQAADAYRKFARKNFGEFYKKSEL